MKDNLGITGEYRIEGFENGVKTIDQTVKNVITQNLFSGLFDALDGDSCALEITHMATGTGTNPALKSNASLQTEVFRKAISAKSQTATTFVVKLSLAAAESVFVIREIGIFAEATDTPGSGVLLSRVNVNIDKNASTQLLITYTITAQ
jgi:hypothetical protein